MWDFCKRCNKEKLEYTTAFLDEDYLADLCDECIDLLNIELKKIRETYDDERKRLIKIYTSRIFNNH